MKISRKAIVLILVFMIFINSYGNVKAASDGTIMEKTLQCYAQKKYKEAAKYGKKLSKTAKESCVFKMSSKMKKEYLKVVRKYPAYNSVKENSKYLWDYYITDIDNDNKADLLIQYGSCQIDVELILYQFKKGKAVKVASTYGGHSSFHAYPDHKGIVRYEAQKGGEIIYTITLKNGKLKLKMIGVRLVESLDDYVELRCNLKSHSSNYTIMYDDLR